MSRCLDAASLVSSRSTYGRLELVLRNRRESCEAARIEAERFLRPYEPAVGYRPEALAGAG